MSEEELLNGWIPYRLLTDANGAISFRWMFTGNHAFVEPFFEESVAACLSLEENRHGLFPVTSPEVVIRVAERCESVAPTAFIYHISRCGSTMLSQLLACDPSNVVLSEVPLLDEILRLTYSRKTKDHGTVEELFRSVLRIIGRRRTANERHLFIKTDSWHILFYDRIRAMFPDLPVFMIFRSPQEVAASQAATPSMHGVPGLLPPELFGLDEKEVLYMDRELYLEYVLIAYLKKYIAISEENPAAALLDYHSGVWAMADLVMEKLNITPGAGASDHMKNRLLFHSKKPAESFEKDADRPAVRHNFRNAEQLFLQLQERSSIIKKVEHGAG